MGKKLLYTPNTTIRHALRQLFLRSRERAAVLKRDNYSCSKCGKKQSRAKGKEVYVEVHHISGVKNWEEMINQIRKFLLNEKDLQCLCKDCHKEETNLQKNGDETCNETDNAERS